MKIYGQLHKKACVTVSYWFIAVEGMSFKIAVSSELAIHN